MPSHYFHLKLELYSQPAASKRRKLNQAEQTTAPHLPYLPPAGSDIFKHPLPAHKTSKWSSYSFSKSPRPDTPTTATSSERSNSPRQIPPSEFTESHGDALLLPERTLNRQTIPKSPALKPAKPSNEAAARDWRYGAVSLESIDMEVQKKSGGGAGLHTKALYLPGEPKTTEVGWGVVHLYRDSEESSVLENDGVASGRKSLDKGRDGGAGFDTEDCTTVCILAVPSWMMPSDLLGFVGDQAREDVSHFRLIRTGRANKYMALMKFRSPKRAKEWQKTYNGRLFSAAEPENCHVVFIKSVEFISPDSTEELEKGKSFPQNNQHDPFTPHGNGMARTADSKSLTSKPLAPPPPNLLELPTCPVCLERMDETTGLLTILCQHVFHCACLEKWRFPGSGCPVCRYTQSPSYTFPYPRTNAGADEEAEPLCSVCATDVNLWICLICGSTGCGRYDSAHAYAHYEATSHCYAMDLSTQHVWDYAGDGYVHRLIQSKPDFSSQQQAPSHSKHSSGSLDYAGAAKVRHENEAYRAEAQDMVPREKMESMANEYTYLLTSQLEGQRRYFEEQVERAVDKASQASLKAESAAQQAEKASADAAAAKTDRESMRDQLTRIETSLAKSEKTKSKFEALARDLSAQLREEKTMNEGLMKRIQAADKGAAEAKVEVEKAREEVKELQDMNHDLSSFISGQEKVRELQAAGEEVEEGGVGVVEKAWWEEEGEGEEEVEVLEDGKEGGRIPSVLRLYVVDSNHRGGDIGIGKDGEHEMNFGRLETGAKIPSMQCRLLLHRCHRCLNIIDAFSQLTIALSVFLSTSPLPMIT